MNKEHVVYKITVGTVGFYIGATNNYSSRISKHEYLVKNIGRSFNKELHSDMKKYGYRFEIIEKTYSREEAGKLEEQWVSFYLKQGNVKIYNKTVGGFKLTGKNNPLAKDKKYWETNSVRIRDFKRTCLVMGWDFNNFCPIFDLNKSLLTKDNSSVYFFVENHRLPHVNHVGYEQKGILTQKQVIKLKSLAKDIDLEYEEKETSVTTFKRLCERLGLQYNDYIRVKGKGNNKYLFFRRSRFTETEDLVICPDKRVYLDYGLDYYKTTSTRRATFKRKCIQYNEIFDNYTEIEDMNAQSKIKKYFYDKKEVSCII